MKYLITIIAFFFLLLELPAQNLLDSFTDGKFITVNGARLWVVVAGKGDPLVIIPGGPGNNHYGYRAFDSLANNNMLIYFDAFGRGKSDTAKDVREYSLDRDIAD